MAGGGRTSDGDLPVPGMGIVRPDGSSSPIPEATLARLPVYMRGLVEVADEGITTVSSRQLADLAGVNAAKVRKDLSHLGAHGKRGVGYDVDRLLAEIGGALGGSVKPVVIVGAGNLGRALSRYDGFIAGGFPVVAIVDSDRSLEGQEISGVSVTHVDRMDEVVVATGCRLGIVATPVHAAQEVVDRLVAAGLRSILNFAPVVVSVPPEVQLRKVDLATELQILGYYEHVRTSSEASEQAAG
ncbi:MAG: redox-sensing transcriptional repressor Rex [Acidimicrobiales bacterium]|nr:redox-sensing transcriptional repressor Rex [Acidimicrobiales bacterium]MEE1521285.1 redox-sensing transcriptional repressor Rex [Acidimicrobiales bacterium]MEE1571035.1 redox-sensing transcriptional repressor Rex [Acidimicrobiales bacterium]